MVSLLNNKALNKAKYSSADTDSWFTTPEIVEQELLCYKPFFVNKKILCNCDDPIESAFTSFFVNHFDDLCLKQLIAVSYKPSKLPDSVCLDHPVLKKLRSAPSAYVLWVTPDKVSVLDAKNNGDFRLNTCLMECSDIVVTNPPFSLFRQLFHSIVEYNLDFLLLADHNAVSYKEVFPLVMNGCCRIGYHSGRKKFRVPFDSPDLTKTFVLDSQKWRSLGSAVWITSLPVDPPPPIPVFRKFDPNLYPVYDSFDAIHVDSLLNIPVDFPGVMGVPITILKKFNPNQFVLLGEANHGNSDVDLFMPTLNGKRVFKRILIKHKL